jgi:hypothetical protein
MLVNAQPSHITAEGYFGSHRVLLTYLTNVVLSYGIVMKLSYIIWQIANFTFYIYF